MDIFHLYSPTGVFLNVTRPGQLVNRTRELEHGPVEIVDLPIENMVILTIVLLTTHSSHQPT